jgi:hypothetical protein
MSVFFCYRTGPIDHWAGLLSKRDLLGSTWITGFQEDLQQLAKVGAALKRLWWEGDIAAGPWFFSMPDPDCCCMRLGFILKQLNNGSTFIVSPFSIPHLEDEGTPSNMEVVVVGTLDSLLLDILTSPALPTRDPSDQYLTPNVQSEGA